MNKEKCKHKIKRNYPFGRKSKVRMYCKICGKVIKGKYLKENRKLNKKERK